MIFANKHTNMLLTGILALAIVACDREPEAPSPSESKSNPYLGIMPLELLQLPDSEPAPGSLFSVQVGLYSDMKEAAPTIEALSKNDYQLMVNRVADQQGVEQNLLRVGEYASLDEASAAAEELQNVTGSQTKVILLPSNDS